MSADFRVTAVIPSCNAMPLVIEAVASVRDQVFPPEEIVVVDDGSDDGTSQAMRELASSPGAPLRVFEGRFGGAAAARNVGWRAARTPWVAFLDADDLWFPQKLRIAAETLEAFGSAQWFFSDGSFRTLGGTLHESWLAVYADLREPYLGHPLAELLEVNFILTSAVMVRRELLEELGGFDERMTHAEDLDLWIRLARRAPAAASPLSLVCYRHRPNSLSRQVHKRLMGDVELFRRLGADPGLTPRQRRRARRRRALAHYKLAFSALRDGPRSALWPELRAAWMFPERALPVSLLGLAALLPAPVLDGLRRRRWAQSSVARRAFTHARVSLHPESGLVARESGVRAP